MKRLLKVWLAVLAMFAVIGCGGGGSGPDLPSADENLTKFDTNNYKRAASTPFKSYELVNYVRKGPFDALGDAGFLADLNQIGQYYKVANEPVADTTETCPQGGTVNINGNVITFNDCKANNYTYNGTLEDSNNSLAFNLTIRSEGEGVETFILKGEASENGNVKELKIDKLKYQFGNKTELELTNYTLKETKVNSNTTKVEINGYVKYYIATGAISIKIKTLQPVVSINDECPTAGKIEVQGDNSTITIEFLSNKNVNVYLNGELKDTLEDCDALESYGEEK